MFRNSSQRGLLTIFFSGGAKPFSLWDTNIQDGYITRFLDQEIKLMVMEIGGTNVSTTYMQCPKGNKVLGIYLPFLVLVVRNLKKYFSFEVTVLDDTNRRRRFRVSNFQSSTSINPMCTVMPIALSDGWNQIQFNLAEFTRRAYKKQFVEVQRLKINANIRIRRIYFAERLLPEEQLPKEYKIFFPIASKGAKSADTKSIKSEKEATKQTTPLVSTDDVKQGNAKGEEKGEPGQKAPDDKKPAEVSEKAKSEGGKSEEGEKVKEPASDAPVAEEAPVAEAAPGSEGEAPAAVEEGTEPQKEEVAEAGTDGPPQEEAQ